MDGHPSMRPTREQSEPPALPYSVLLRLELARFTPRPEPFDPAGHRHCGAGPRLAADGCYPLACSVELGLSSNAAFRPMRPRPSSRLQGPIVYSIRTDVRNYSQNADAVSPAQWKRRSIATTSHVPVSFRISNRRSTPRSRCSPPMVVRANPTTVPLAFVPAMPIDTSSVAQIADSISATSARISSGEDARNWPRWTSSSAHSVVLRAAGTGRSHGSDTGSSAVPQPPRKAAARSTTGALADRSVHLRTLVLPVDRHVAEAIGILVQRPRDVPDRVAVELAQHVHDRGVDRLQVGMLHAVDPRDLARDQLGVHPEVDVRRPEPECLLQREAHGGPLGNVVGRVAERLGDLGQYGAVGRVTQDGPGAGRTGIAAGGAIGVDQDPRHRSPALPISCVTSRIAFVILIPRGQASTQLNVVRQRQTPSGSAMISSRSCFALSRVSTMKRWALTIAAGPTYD